MVTRKTSAIKMADSPANGINWGGFKHQLVQSIIGKTIAIGKRKTPDTKTLKMVETQTYLGWAAFGVATRGFQLGILRKPFNYNSMYYVYSAALWVAIGHVFTKGVESQDALLEDRINKLQAARAARHSAATPAPEN